MLPFSSELVWACEPRISTRPADFLSVRRPETTWTSKQLPSCFVELCQSAGKTWSVVRVWTRLCINLSKFRVILAGVVCGSSLFSSFTPSLPSLSYLVSKSKPHGWLWRLNLTLLIRILSLYNRWHLQRTGSLKQSCPIYQSQYAGRWYVQHTICTIAALKRGFSLLRSFKGRGTFQPSLCLLPAPENMSSNIKIQMQ